MMGPKLSLISEASSSKMKIQSQSMILDGEEDLNLCSILTGMRP
jgi:hypothetical protein